MEETQLQVADNWQPSERMTAIIQALDGQGESDPAGYFEQELQDGVRREDIIEGWEMITSLFGNIETITEPVPSDTNNSFEAQIRLRDGTVLFQATFDERGIVTAASITQQAGIRGQAVALKNLVSAKVQGLFSKLRTRTTGSTTVYPMTPEARLAFATETLWRCDEGDFSMIGARLTAAKSADFSETIAAESWNRSVDSVEEVIVKEYHDDENLAVVTFSSRNDTFNLEVQFAPDGRISRWFVAGKQTDEYTEPTWVDTGQFTERDVDLPCVSGVTPARVTIPDNPVEDGPGIVLIPGSGPHDMDGTIGAIKPLRDLA